MYLCKIGREDLKWTELAQ